MPNRSSVPAVKAALFGLMQTALPGTQVLWANTTANVQRESAWMGNADFSEEVVASFMKAPLPHNEAYVVPVVVMALMEGDDPQATEERAWELAASVEDALRTPPNDTLGVPGVHWAKIVNKQPALYTRDNGWCMFVDMLVGVQARI